MLQLVYNAGIYNMTILVKLLKSDYFSQKLTLSLQAKYYQNLRASFFIIIIIIIIIIITIIITITFISQIL